MSLPYDEMDAASKVEFKRLNGIIKDMGVSIARLSLIAWLSLIITAGLACWCIFRRERSYPRFEQAEHGFIFDRDQGFYLKPSGERFTGIHVN